MTAHAPVDDTFAAALRRKIDGKTKPVGALGRVEALAAQIARVQGTLAPRMATCGLTIFAADHGLAAEGVSAYPQAVTRQMVLNFLDGNAAANVFARSVGASLRVVDAGVAGAPIADPRLLARRIGPGTRNARREPAMTAAERDRALAEGRALGADGAFDAVCFGEMGIANTSAATLLAHKLAGLPLDTLVGRGTGLDDAGLARKRAILADAAARTPVRHEQEGCFMGVNPFLRSALIGAALVAGMAAPSFAQTLTIGVRARAGIDRSAFHRARHACRGAEARLRHAGVVGRQAPARAAARRILEGRRRRRPGSSSCARASNSTTAPTSLPRT